MDGVPEAEVDVLPGDFVLKGFRRAVEADTVVGLDHR